MEKRGNPPAVAIFGAACGCAALALVILAYVFGYIPYEYSQLSLKKMSRGEATKIYVQRSTSDHRADWKMPIDFYGKVVDEKGNPVSGAAAHCGWNDLSLTGSSETDEVSGDDGKFSLTSRRGKILEVRVQKEGYYPSNGGGGAFFEFANPSSPDYYEPDSSDPVIFKLQKKQAPRAVPFLEAKMFLKYGTEDCFFISRRSDLDFGFMKVDLVGAAAPGPQLPTYRIKITPPAGGGLLETKEQYPFNAPLSGYASSETIDMSKADPTWLSKGNRWQYYFHLSNGIYGRMRIDPLDVTGGVVVSVRYLYNPIPNDQQLESFQPTLSAWY